MPSGRQPEIIRHADIRSLSTFRLPARAAELCIIDTPEQLAALPETGAEELVLGGGSNTVFVGNFAGRIILNRMRGIEFADAGEHVLVRAAAGENWHFLVRQCLDRGLHGIENLAMIPGSAGAAPMQNIGAYGVELADVFESLEALDRQRGEVVRIRRGEAGFGYRDSRFRSADAGRFLITAVKLRLARRFEPRLDYSSLAAELERQGNSQPTPRQLVATIMQLRRHRLPDPQRLANAGSFFKNPIVADTFATALLEEHPGLPHWPMGDGQIKLAAAWMIEKLGWKGRFIGDAGVYPHHALVLVNRGQATASELLALIEAITKSVLGEFGVALQPEPLLLGYCGFEAGTHRPSGASPRPTIHSFPGLGDVPDE